MALVAWVGVVLAGEGFPSLAQRIRGFPTVVRCLWVLALPALLLLTDWQGRVYLGLVPSSSRLRSAMDDVSLGVSASLMAESSSREAVNAQSRLRAKGDEHGNLSVERLDGGPAFHRPPDIADRMVSFVLFSPNGRTLVVGDNNRMYEGSKITIWDVAPGNDGGPLNVRLRRELTRGEHWCFAASFFPDGRTLVVSNGDKTVSLWDADSGRQISSFVPHASEPWGYAADCVAAATDGQTFATWALNGIKVWDRSSLHLVRAMDTRQAIGIALSYTPDGSALIALDRERLTLWKVAPSCVPVLLLSLLLIGIIVWIGYPAAAPPARTAPSASVPVE